MSSLGVNLSWSALSTFFPPTYERWRQINTTFTGILVAVSMFLWLVPPPAMGKTSVVSKLNLPGKLGWVLMELVGPINVAFIMYTLPTTELPMRNNLLAGLYIFHYINRALVTPIFLADSFSPIHLSVVGSAVFFNYLSSSTIACWLAGYGGDVAQRQGQPWQIGLGLAIFLAGMMGNILAEGHLREIRREAAIKQAGKGKEMERQTGKKVKMDKIYALPKKSNPFFKYCLYPHYTLEWIEWAGYWMIGGWEFTPAALFLFNEIAIMLPRALSGRRWYVEKFGKDAVGDSRGALIPRFWGVG